MYRTTQKFFYLKTEQQQRVPAQFYFSQITLTTLLMFFILYLWAIYLHKHLIVSKHQILIQISLK